MRHLELDSLVEETAGDAEPRTAKRHIRSVEADSVCRRARVAFDARFEVQLHGGAYPERRMIGERKSRALLFAALLFLFSFLPFLALFLAGGARTTIQRTVLGGWLGGLCRHARETREEKNKYDRQNCLHGLFTTSELDTWRTKGSPELVAKLLSRLATVDEIRTTCLDSRQTARQTPAIAQNEQAICRGGLRNKGEHKSVERRLSPQGSNSCPFS